MSELRFDLSKISFAEISKHNATFHSLFLQLHSLMSIGLHRFNTYFLTGNSFETYLELFPIIPSKWHFLLVSPNPLVNVVILFPHKGPNYIETLSRYLVSYLNPYQTLQNTVHAVTPPFPGVIFYHRLYFSGKISWASLFFSIEFRNIPTSESLHFSFLLLEQFLVGIFYFHRSLGFPLTWHIS